MGVEYRYDKDTNEKVVRLDTDYTTARAANLDNLDQAISTTEANIRGVDNDTLKSLSDQIDAAQLDITAILADTNELQSDWTNGGRLDLILDAVLADTNELQSDWTNGGRLDLILDETAADAAAAADSLADGGFTNLILDDILADTNEVQASLADGGFTNLILDAILEDTGTTLPASLTAMEAEIQGADDRDLTEVYNLVNTSANPFRLTTYTTKSGAAVQYVPSTWTDIYVSGALSKDTEITGFKITNSAGAITDPVFRITLSDGTTKVFPYGVSDPVRSAKLEEFQFPVRIPSTEDYKVQVNCTANAGGVTATLTELDVIEVG